MCLFNHGTKPALSKFQLSQTDPTHNTCKPPSRFVNSVEALGTTAASERAMCSPASLNINLESSSPSFAHIDNFLHNAAINGLSNVV